jgi:hypothetical protein
LHPWFEVIDGRDQGTHPLGFAFVLRPEDFRENGIEHEVPDIILADPACRFDTQRVRDIEMERTQGRPESHLI